MLQPLWKTVWRFLRKLNIELPFDLTIPLLGIYQEKNFQKYTCTHVFIATLFTIVKTWKHPKCPLTDEWIKKIWYKKKKKIWYIYIMQHYSAIKRNKILAFAATWIQIEILILSEVRKRKINTI